MRFSILCICFFLTLPLFSVRLQASGFQNMSIKVGDHIRTYRLFVPSDLPNPVPVVFVFHGTETPGHGIDSILKITRFEEIGEMHHALVIFPEAYEGNWNDGRLNNRAKSYRDGIDDIAFVDAMLAQIERDYHVDRTRIDATGFSKRGNLLSLFGCSSFRRFRGDRSGQRSDRDPVFCLVQSSVPCVVARDSRNQ